MVYKLVNSQRVIGRIMENYVIDYSDFISRVPNWIFSAMRLINAMPGYIDLTVPGMVEDHKCMIPSHTKKLQGVSYQGFRLPRLERVNEAVTDDMPKLKHKEHKYQLGKGGIDDKGNAIGDGYIITTFLEGDIKFYIKAFPLVKDEETQLWFPLIPDKEEVYDALEQYVLRRILGRGHKVGDLSLKENNEFLNPGLAWEKHRKKARNAISRMDTDQREILSKKIRTFLSDYNFYTQGNFNPTENTDELGTGTYS